MPSCNLSWSWMDMTNFSTKVRTTSTERERERETQIFITGTINDIVSTKGRNTYLTVQGFHNNLDEFIFKNPSQRNVSKGLMADTVEAILGAVYLDSGKDISAVQDVMKALDLFDPETVVMSLYSAPP